jgi:hypothetical protein
MQAYRVTVDERLSRGTDPGRDYRGRCYEMALKYLYLVSHREEPTLRLVHGTLHIVGVPFPHAWVEIEGCVFDPVSQEFYDRDAYYRVLEAEAERVYTAAEAGRLAMRTAHCGPWHTEEGDGEA